MRKKFGFMVVALAAAALLLGDTNLLACHRHRCGRRGGGGCGGGCATSYNSGCNSGCNTGCGGCDAGGTTGGYDMQQPGPPPAPVPDQASPSDNQPPAGNAPQPPKPSASVPANSQGAVAAVPVGTTTDFYAARPMRRGIFRR